ncbi:MAG: RluA family pseudouridine synthase [Myxococcales bacterium]|nr:RluA family pseudouridine synthase [Myxococcales bacterium]
MDAVRWFEPPPSPAEVPAVMPSPFALGPPHPLAARAAAELVAELRADPRPLDGDAGGKMFGVLVVHDAAGRVGYLRGFSGMLRGAWFVDGFAPPLFDPDDRARFWPAGEAELAGRTAAVAAAAAHLAEVTTARAAQLAEHAAARAILDDELGARRAARHLGRSATGDAAALAAFDAHSREDGRRRREQVAAQRAARAALDVAVAEATTAHAQLDADRAACSRALYARVGAGYVVTSARGARHALAALYAPGPPPGGAGDCAAPKLIAHAHRLGLTPVALAELWWGPPRDGRFAGGFYPACRGKCGPLVPVLLDGVLVEPAPEPGADAVGPDEPAVLFADAWIVVVAKPVGLLSVPGRSGRLRDCVATRLRARAPGLDGPVVVHRLDLDTSGLLVCARDPATHAALQARFARREVAKRYVAIVDGDVADDAGTIELPLRLDPDDRPRQVVDAVHGKAARTDYRVLARADGRTRLALYPVTGRTHQLRVHCATGLGAPIVGDRLYGRAPPPADQRLLLHAEALAFTHPHTGGRIELTLPAPF